MRKIGNRWALGFLGLGICTLLGNLALSVGFAVPGERLTRTLRNMAFKAMVMAKLFVAEASFVHVVGVLL